MSEYSGAFDQLADALISSGASPSATLRHARAARQRAHAARATKTPTPPEPIAVARVSAAKRPREIDRSRDHAVYAAPHRPMRAHAHSRPDDIPTERALPRVPDDEPVDHRAPKKRLLVFAMCAAAALSSAGAALFYALY